MFKSWLLTENSNEEINFLAQLITSLPNLDTTIAGVFADWLEEQGRGESPWLRAVAARSKKIPNKVLMNKYLTGISVSNGKYTWDTVASLIHGADIRADQVTLTKLKAVWEPLLKLYLTFSGPRVRSLTGKNHICLSSRRGVWWRFNREVGAFPVEQVDEVPAPMQWAAFIYLLPMEGWAVR